MPYKNKFDQRLNEWFRRNPRSMNAVIGTCVFVMVVSGGFVLGGFIGGSPLLVQIPVVLLVGGAMVTFLWIDHIRPAIGQDWRRRYPSIILLPRKRVSLLMLIAFGVTLTLGYLSADSLNWCANGRARC